MPSTTTHSKHLRCCARHHGSLKQRQLWNGSASPSHERTSFFCFARHARFVAATGHLLLPGSLSVQSIGVAQAVRVSPLVSAPVTPSSRARSSRAVSRAPAPGSSLRSDCGLGCAFRLSCLLQLAKTLTPSQSGARRHRRHGLNNKENQNEQRTKKRNQPKPRLFVAQRGSPTACIG